jgi:hypothetical protein
MTELIREWDPFSGHREPEPEPEVAPVVEEPEPVVAIEEPPAKPKQRRTRRPRRVPSAAEVQAAAAKVRRT